MVNDLESLLSRLVAIDSVNPSLVPGARGEAEIGAFVAEWMRSKGLEVKLQETGAPGRENVVAVARGSGGGRSLLLNAHMDTVGVSGMSSPFQPVTRDGKLFGRGAMDTKGALAAFMSAAAEARALKTAGGRDPDRCCGRGICEYRHRGGGAELETGRRDRR